MPTKIDQLKSFSPATSALCIVSPLAGATFPIAAGSVWPSIRFETNAVLLPGQQLEWAWTISWREWLTSGKQKTNTSFWQAGETFGFCGGKLDVKVVGPTGTASISVKLRGSIVAEAEVAEYLAGRPNSAGFERILRHETRMMHFDSSGEPLVSGDLGYGICQLTNPKPTFEQCWNWKLNIDQGLNLYAEKQLAAVRYLSRLGRSFTAEELQRETIARWNGGSYHVWSMEKNSWIRNPDILCDSCTGNVGWNLKDPRNLGKTEAELHERDKAKFRGAARSNDGWFYSGVCYADRILAS